MTEPWEHGGLFPVTLDDGAVKPVRATPYSAGLDLAALGDYDLTAGPMRAMVRTGVNIAIPDGFAGFVFERSSLHKRGFSLENKVGVIDSDYRGEILLPMSWSDWWLPDVVAYGDDAGHIHDGERIAQLVIMPVWLGRLQEVGSLPFSARGDGGFGSTGR